MITAPELSDEEIEKQLASESVRGPRKWRGRELAPLSRGLRALRNKVVASDDPSDFHDLALVSILCDAYAPDKEGRLLRRRGLILATDDTTGFRAGISLLLDDCSEDELAEARKLTDELLGLVEKAEVSLAEKKTDSQASAEPSPTPTPSPSSTPAKSSGASRPTRRSGS